jgi:hypothetical protein
MARDERVRTEIPTCLERTAFADHRPPQGSQHHHVALDEYLTINGKQRRFVLSEGILCWYNSKGFLKSRASLIAEPVVAFRTPQYGCVNLVEGTVLWSNHQALASMADFFYWFRGSALSFQVVIGDLVLRLEADSETALHKW